MTRSRSGISAIFASTSRSPSSLLGRAAFTSVARSRIAARSASVNPVEARVVLADRC